MNVLVIGSGGREHALCYAASKSKYLDKLYAIPGNPGINQIATCVDIDPMDNRALKTFALENEINLIIPGSEVYLENGITDTFLDTHIKVFGPTKQAARIESSKEYAKDLMKKYNIPTAKYQVFDDFNDAKAYVEQEGTPIVIKYNGLAGGKGVVVAMTKKEALDALSIMLIDKVYGNSNVVIEEFLEGPEFSFMTFVNEDIVIPMPISQDHKRLLDQDKGPNTGGMGIYSSVPIIPNSVIQDAFENIMVKTAQAMKQENNAFTGFLYGGLMYTKEGPKVIEFNARFGDPETEVILPKLQSDFIEVILRILEKETLEITWSNEYYVGVVLASKGYPNHYEKGYLIQGIDTISDLVFHMGTKQDSEGIKTNGGRVLLVTGKGKTLQDARDKAYQNIEKIKCDNLIYRTDIGYKAL